MIANPRVGRIRMKRFRGGVRRIETFPGRKFENILMFCRRKQNGGDLRKEYLGVGISPQGEEDRKRRRNGGAQRKGFLKMKSLREEDRKKNQNGGGRPKGFLKVINREETPMITHGMGPRSRVWIRVNLGKRAHLDGIGLRWITGTRVLFGLLVIMDF